MRVQMSHKNEVETVYKRHIVNVITEKKRGRGVNKIGIKRKEALRTATELMNAIRVLLICEAEILKSPT